MAKDALGQLQRALDLDRGSRRKLKPMQNVKTVAKTANGIGQPLAAPGVDVLHGAAALGDQRLNARRQSFYSCFVKVRVEHDHQFVVSHRSSFLWVAAPSTWGRKGCWIIGAEAHCQPYRSSAHGSPCMW